MTVQARRRSDPCSLPNSTCVSTGSRRRTAESGNTATNVPPAPAPGRGHHAAVGQAFQRLARRPAGDKQGRCALLLRRQPVARVPVTGDDRVPQPEYYQLMEAREESQRIVVEIKAENHLDAICFPRVRINAPTTDDVLAASWTCLEFPTNTVIASQLWMPAITIPAGFTDNGLPVGLELMALPYQGRNCSVRRTASSRPPTPGRPPSLRVGHGAGDLAVRTGSVAGLTRATETLGAAHCACTGGGSRPGAEADWPQRRGRPGACADRRR